MNSLYRDTPILQEMRSIAEQMPDLESKLVDCVPLDDSAVSLTCSEMKMEHDKLEERSKELEQSDALQAYKEEATHINNLYLTWSVYAFIPGALAMMIGLRNLMRRK